jgi:hypothetical protein
MIFSLLSCYTSPLEISPKKQLPKPDILLVVLDTTRADALMTYGNARPVGENAHQLAQEGAWFTQAWSSSSWTWPAHASLFTGLYPWEHGAHFAPPSQAISLKPDPLYASELSKETKTLAERLKEEGYDTVSFSANRLVGPDFTLVRGFDISEFHDDDSKVAQRAQSFLTDRKDKQSQKPLFLFINLMSAHTPWFFNDEPWVTKHKDILQVKTAPEWSKPHLLPNGIGLHPFFPNFSESLVHQYILGQKPIPAEGKVVIRDLYEAEVRRSDLHFGMIRAVWNNPNSIIALTSDHGEYLTEHQLLEHGRTLYPEVLHVPLIIKSPNIASQRIDHPIPVHFLHDEILRQAGFEAKNSLFEAPNALYAGAWEDHYWSTSMGAPFDRGYRLKRIKKDVFILDSKAQCSSYVLKNQSISKTKNTCPVEIREELTKLFSQAKTGSTVQPTSDTLKQLKELGYIGNEEESQ